MNYSGTRLRDEIVISELFTVHYFEFSSNYNFAGESHNFWELVYVDKGEITARADEKNILLKTGDIIFHKPNEFHTITASGDSAPSCAVVSFRAAGAALSCLEGLVFHTGNKQRTLLSQIITDAENAFDTPLSDLYTPKLHRRKNAAVGAEQLLRMHLCELLLSIIRHDEPPAASSLKRNLDKGLFMEICSFLEESIGKKLSLDDIARAAGISRTALKQLFHDEAGCGACEYFIRLKIDRAKTYIRGDCYNFTQIAELLGYDSIHYFSRQFRKYVNMSPTEYAGSIRALTGEAQNFSGGDRTDD